MTDAVQPFRIATLDLIRGVAVMGILVANLPAFGLPDAAYFSPLAAGGTTPPDIVVWFATFVLVEGKMRGLFSFLFGASMALMIDRAGVEETDAAAVHFRRMATLLAIGCAHLYLLWWGDILGHYALVGGIAFVFVRLPVRWLLGVAIGFLLLQMLVSGNALLALVATAARDTPQKAAVWDAFAQGFGVPSGAELAAETAIRRGSYWAGVASRWRDAVGPLTALPLVGPETMSAMLLGIAGYRSGFLTGAWQRVRYRRWAATCLGIALPAYALLGWSTLAHGFDQRWVYADSILLSQPFRLIAMVGYAALLMLVIRPGGRLTTRIAATGRTAFTNYLATSLVMTFVFDGWGLGLFGAVSRAQLYLLVPVAWGIMLAWPGPWLSRFRYGPLEWVWRSLARLEMQPLRRA